MWCKVTIYGKMKESLLVLLLGMLLYTIKVPTPKYECTFELHRS